MAYRRIYSQNVRKFLIASGIENHRFKKGNKLQLLGNGNWKEGKIKKYCKNCNKEFEVFPCFRGKKFCSQKCYYSFGRYEAWNKGLTKETDVRVLKYTKKKIGDKSHFWKGGKSFEPYGIEFSKILKEKIMRRDNYICQECKMKKEQLKWGLVVHHIDFNKKNNNPNNLITLCRSCHNQTQFNQENWIKYYQEKMNVLS